MPRRRSAILREVHPDPKYGSVDISKFINCLMERGKKSVGSAIVYGALDTLQDKGGKGIDTFNSALENVKPFIEVRSKRVGGATYQVPFEVRKSRALALAIRWIITAAKKRTEKSMQMKLAGEFLDAANNRGAAVKKKEETHKMAEANKAFSHYRM